MNQREIHEALGVKTEIDPIEEVKNRVRFLADYIRHSGTKGLVLGISGGQDSTLAGKLSQLAVEKLREEGYEATFHAVRLPYGVQADESDAQAALSFIQPDHSSVFNIKDSVEVISYSYLLSQGLPLKDFDKGNVKARTRMMVQYAIAGEHRLLVVGTDHAAEAVTGFFTKFGDGGSDVLPLSGLTKNQGKQLLQHLGAPEHLYLKQPTADLLDETPQQSDESELGITYQEIDNFLLNKKVDNSIETKLIERYRITEHKRQLPVTPLNSWWK